MLNIFVLIFLALTLTFLYFLRFGILGLTFLNTPIIVLLFFHLWWINSANLNHKVSLEDPISLSATLDRIENESEVYKYIYYIYWSQWRKEKVYRFRESKNNSLWKIWNQICRKKISFIFGNWLFFKIWFFYFEIKGRPDSGFYILEFK